jgi:hypothetical protein
MMAGAGMRVNATWRCVLLLPLLAGVRIAGGGEAPAILKLNATTSLISPLFRGRIARTRTNAHGVRTQGCAAIQLSAHIDAPAGSVGGAVVVEAALHVWRAGAAAEPLERASAHAVLQLGTTAVRLGFTCTPGALPPGRYSVTVTLRHGGAAAALIGAHVLTRVDDAEPEPVSFIDEARRLIHCGRPFFPIGLYTGEVTIGAGDGDPEKIAATRFNTVMSYRPPGAAHAAAMDQLAAAGLKVVMGRTVK